LEATFLDKFHQIHAITSPDRSESVTVQRNYTNNVKKQLINQTIYINQTEATTCLLSQKMYI